MTSTERVLHFVVHMLAAEAAPIGLINGKSLLGYGLLNEILNDLKLNTGFLLLLSNSGKFFFSRIICEGFDFDEFKFCIGLMTCGCE